MRARAGLVEGAHEKEAYLYDKEAYLYDKEAYLYEKEAYLYEKRPIYMKKRPIYMTKRPIYMTKARVEGARERGRENGRERARANTRAREGACTLFPQIPKQTNLQTPNHKHRSPAPHALAEDHGVVHLQMRCGRQGQQRTPVVIEGAVLYLDLH